MSQLADAVADTLDRLSKAASAMGRTLTLSPDDILLREPLHGFGAPGLWSTNRTCRLVKTRDGWIAVNLAREEDRDSVPAWTGCALDADPWDVVVEYARTQTAQELLACAIALHLPVAIAGEAKPAEPPIWTGALRRTRRPKALDLSALWAGPLCGGLLAKAGLDVTRIDNTTRPDPTARVAPRFDAWLNGDKHRCEMALDDPRLTDLIADADVLITSGRPHALARKGLSEARLATLHPGLIWVAVTAHGWRGDDALRVGFGDDAAAAGGLLAGTREAPMFMGDALADPLTGLEAATGVIEALIEGKCGLIDAALAPTAATYAKRTGLR